MDRNTKYLVVVVALVLLAYSLWKYEQYQECVAYWRGAFGDLAYIWIKQYC